MAIANSDGPFLPEVRNLRKEFRGHINRDRFIASVERGGIDVTAWSRAV
jgi:hypothetical protein